MVSAAHLCLGPDVGYCAGNPDITVGAMTSGSTQPFSSSNLEERTMPELELPPCTLDLRDPSNCVNIAMAKPGESIRVMMRTDDNATATPMEAMGTLSNDGKSFSVVVTTEHGGLQRYDLSYRDLLKTLSDLS